MSDADLFAAFVRRIRGGDDRAAGELVRQYESAIRREVRLRLRDPRLRTLFDSMDVCQSVLASFFVGAAAGQYDLESPGHLVRLLVGIARHKVAEQARRHQAQRRDHRRAEPLDPDRCPAVDPNPSPSRIAAGRELLQQVRQRLTAEERRLSELRAQGLDWAAIAASLGGTPDGLRMQLQRGLRRVARELGVEGPADE